MGGKTTQRTTVPQWQEDYITGTVLPFAQNIADTEFTPYGGDLTIDASPYAGRAADLYRQVGAVASMTPADYAAMTQANMNPYQQNVIDATLAQSAANYADTQAGLLSDIAGSGAFGNERRGVAEGQLAADYALGNQATIANLLQQGYSDAQAQTMAQIGNQLSAGQAGASGLANLGLQDTGVQQANIQMALDEFLREQQNPYDQLTALTMGASAMPNQSTTTQSKSLGLLDIIGAGASLFS